MSNKQGKACIHKLLSWGNARGCSIHQAVNIICLVQRVRSDFIMVPGSALRQISRIYLVKMDIQYLKKKY